MNKRNDILGVISIGIVALVLFGVTACKNINQAESRPNILFIMSDDHATHAISSYGSKVNTTPNIDRLAQEGVQFESAFCTNSICSPSRATILTGKYSHLNGVIDNHVSFDGSQQTLPKLLRKSGYQTAIVGKWHLKSQPTGFDYSLVLPGQGEYHNPIMIEEGREKKYTGYVTDIITSEALKWLKNRQSAKPFFLMLHHKAPHANWEPDAKYEDLYSHIDIPLPATFNDDYKTRTAQIKNHRLHVGPKQWELHFQERLGNIQYGMTEQETREWVYQKYMKNYLRCIASVDENIGRVLDYLEQSGLSKNTLVVYTSDQGFFLGDHGLYDKRFMYEQSLRIPLLMKYPQHIKPGTITDEIVLNLDFASTILDYANVPIPMDIQGESFRNMADGKEMENWRRTMYYRFYESGFGVGPHEGIRTKRYKLIHYSYGDEGWELYDLKKDPDELNNIYTKPERKILINELMAEMSILKKEYKLEEKK